MPKLRFGQIGLGHWGPNLFRNFYEHDDVDVQVVCDLDLGKREKVKRFEVAFTTSTADVLAADNGLDAVVIATPVATHYGLAKQALLNGKHVFVEKPLAGSLSEGVDLVALAEERERFMMVGHVFLYNHGITHVKELIDAGALGRIHFIHSQRTNLGPVRADVNALWDLGAHDISIFNYWLGGVPEAVTSCGCRVLAGSQDDVVTATLSYADNVSCHLLVSWLHPCKVRQITVVGEKKMVVWDDMSFREPVRIFDKRVELQDESEQTEGTFAEFKFHILEGDVVIPTIRQSEPLRSECDDFVRAILTGACPLSDGAVGVDVLRVLAAADSSQLQASAEVSVRGGHPGS